MNKPKEWLEMERYLELTNRQLKKHLCDVMHKQLTQATGDANGEAELSAEVLSQ